jgi:hypothetical protein
VEAIQLPTSSLSIMSCTIKTKKINLEVCETTLATQFGCITFHPSRYGCRANLTLTVRNKWTSGWDSNWFYYRVPSEQVADVWGKMNYPLGSTMTPLDYLADAPIECGPGDANVAAFIEASIIGGHGVMEDFLACGIWPLSKSCEFEVETKEMPLSKVMVPMSKVTPTIGRQESEAAFEERIMSTANLLVGNYNVVVHNAYIRFWHGWLNRVFELAGVLFQPHPESIPRAPMK